MTALTESAPAEVVRTAPHHRTRRHAPMGAKLRWQLGQGHHRQPIPTTTHTTSSSRCALRCPEGVCQALHQQHTNRMLFISRGDSILSSTAEMPPTAVESWKPAQATPIPNKRESGAHNGWTATRSCIR